MAGAQKTLFFAGLSRGQNEGQEGGRERETYESYKLYVGFELNPLAGDRAGDSKNCGRTRPYDAGDQFVGRRALTGFECTPSSSAPGWRVLPNEPRLS